MNKAGSLLRGFQLTESLSIGVSVGLSPGYMWLILWLPPPLCVSVLGTVGRGRIHDVACDQPGGYARGCESIFEVWTLSPVVFSSSLCACSKNPRNPLLHIQALVFVGPFFARPSGILPSLPFNLNVSCDFLCPHCRPSGTCSSWPISSFS